jgi:hypothetical protein
MEGQDGAFEVITTLEKGLNDIRVEAWDAVGNHNLTTLEIHYRPRDVNGEEPTPTLVLVLIAVVVAVIVVVFLIKKRPTG